MRTICGLIVALSLATTVARAADPYAAIAAMRSAFAHIRSVTAIERFSGGTSATVSYSAPNRYRIQMPGSELLIVGNAEYASVHGHGWTRGAHGKEHQALMHAAWQLAGPVGVDVHKLFRVTFLGNKEIDGASARGYILHDLTGAYDEVLWIGPNDLPMRATIQMPSETVRINYIAYNASVLIATPL